MKIYLAGSVPKGDKEVKGHVDWRKVYFEKIKQVISNAELFDPNIFYKLEGDSKAIAGADCLCIQQSDMVVVNSEDRLGAGTAMEFVIAKYFNKPVVVVLPKNTHHRRSNIKFNDMEIEDWIHPFVETFSDIILEDISEFKIVPKTLKNKTVKGINTIDEAIIYAKKILEET